MQISADREKQITIKAHDPPQFSAFVCVISTQPSAVTHLPAETGAVTMVKNREKLCLPMLRYISFLIVPGFTEDIPADFL